MKNNILNKIDIYEWMTSIIVGYFDKRLNLKDEDKQRLCIGVKVILINLFKMLLVIIIAFYMNLLKEAVITFTIFASLRVSAAGMHLKSSLSCTIACIISYIGTALITNNFPLDIKLTFLISIFLGFILYKYSPADTENRPILGRQHRAKLKRRTVITSIILIAINLILQNTKLFNLTMYAFLIQSICVIPITYKLAHQNYDNYKNYED